MFILDNHIPRINKNATIIFSVPTKYINQDGRPYIENSSFIELASPPLYLVFLLNLKIQTLINVIEITKLISVVIVNMNTKL